MGISETIAPNSDQLDAVDLLTGPRTFTITGVVVKASADQPVDISLAEFPRVWRPGKSMRRVLVSVWGEDEQTYIGRKVTLFCEPRVKFGGAEVGGTRISHMSHIDSKRSIPLIVSKGKSATYTVQPLIESAAPASAAEITADTIAASESIPTLRRWWKKADADTRTLIEARVKALEEAALGDEPA